MIVQGDVYLLRIAEIPEGATLKGRTQRGSVIAEGEMSGHAHVIADDVALYELEGILYIRNCSPVIMIHEEHAPISLVPGIWQVGRVREYDVFDPYHDRLIQD